MMMSQPGADLAEPLRMLHRACDGGDPGGCINLGVAYARGLGVKQDFETTRTFYQKACDLDVTGAACGNLGGILLVGQGVTRDVPKGLSLLARACRQQVASSCLLAGLAYLNGDGATVDRQRAAGFLARACDLHHDLACQKLRLVRGVPVNPSDLPSLEKGCELRLPGACTRLARAYTELDKGFKRATPLLEKSCSQSALDACAELAARVSLDDPTSGFALVEKTCAQGDGHGCAVLAGMVRGGVGTEANEARALELYRGACEAREPDACRTLADILRDGTRTTPRDLPRARIAYENGCSVDDAVSCGKLGAMFTFGEGGPADPKRAKLFLEKACKSSVESACSMLGH
jgi:TPR repeat protein